MRGQPRYRAGTELVNVSVIVTDRHAKHVSGLSVDQFEILEDGKPQDVSFFADGSVPVDVALLLDTSGSMAAALPLIQQAATSFVRALRPIDRAAVISLTNRPPVLQPMTADTAALASAIRRTSSYGETPLYVSIYSTLHLMAGTADRDQVRRQALVLLTDGIDTGGGFGFPDLLAVVRTHAIPIYVIAPRLSTVAAEQQEAVLGRSIKSIDYELRQLASDTGGRSFFPRLINDLNGIYRDVAEELAHQYVLGYYPSETGGREGFRKLTIRVATAGVEWRARSGYLLAP
ncbi:MAG: VWA domain-containing protein [Cyanobacteria bacterium]|nr:VWA domain-containing protein [Cyanobacteriota bacterium]